MLPIELVKVKANDYMATHDPIKIVIKGNQLVPLHPVHDGDLEHFHRCVEKPLIICKASGSTNSVSQKFILKVNEHEVGLG